MDLDPPRIRHLLRRDRPGAGASLSWLGSSLNRDAGPIARMRPWLLIMVRRIT
jgi:hypothetical protein